MNCAALLARFIAAKWSLGLRDARPTAKAALCLPFALRKSYRPFHHRPSLPPSVPIELSRVMVPDDTNPLGKVHGGTILKLVEQAGNIVATRYCNKGRGRREPLIAVLARVDHIDFHESLAVGEVSQLQAAVTYTSARSIEITVDVWAENVLAGTRCHTNSARLWYVAVLPGGDDSFAVGKLAPVEVPQLEGLSEDERSNGRQRYQKQKQERERDGGLGSSGPRKATMAQCYGPRPDLEEHTVLASQSTLANIVLPSDCAGSYVVGGTLMKMMDNVAGIAAIRHCRMFVLTACIEAIDFHEPVRSGEVMFFTARPTFTSNRSIEVEVTCDAEGIQAGYRQVASAFFTFAAIGDPETLIAPLKVKTDDERERFDEGRRRYTARKEIRRLLTKRS